MEGGCSALTHGVVEGDFGAAAFTYGALVVFENDIYTHWNVCCTMDFFAGGSDFLLNDSACLILMDADFP